MVKCSRIGGVVAALLALVVALVLVEDYQRPPRPPRAAVLVGGRIDGVRDATTPSTAGATTTTTTTAAVNPKTGAFNYGLYTHALSGLNYSRATGSFWSHFTTHKQWQYYSVDSDAYWIGFAVANLGYVANGFIYAVDKRAVAHDTHTAQHNNALGAPAPHAAGDRHKYEFTALSPLAMAVTQGDDIISGCTVWSGHGASMRLCSSVERGQQDVSFRAPLTRTHDGTVRDVSFRGTFAHTEAMSLLFPLEANRPAHTHKYVGMALVPGTGAIRFGADAPDEPLSANTLCGMDFTKSLSERVTQWKWASLHTAHATNLNADGVNPKALGINLSDDVFVYADGHSAENAVWVDGTVHFAGSVDFVLPSPPTALTTSVWRIATRNPADDVQLQLTFQPLGTRAEQLNLGLIVSDFVQPFGLFDGTISVVDRATKTRVTYAVHDAWGVVESHYAKW